MDSGEHGRHSENALRSVVVVSRRRRGSATAPPSSTVEKIASEKISTLKLAITNHAQSMVDTAAGLDTENAVNHAAVDSRLECEYATDQHQLMVVRRVRASPMRRDRATRTCVQSMEAGQNTSLPVNAQLLAVEARS